jgi:hypothetical protein
MHRPASKGEGVRHGTTCKQVICCMLPHSADENVASGQRVCVRAISEGRTLHGEPMAPSMAQPMCKPKPMFVLKPKTPRGVRVGATYSRTLRG